MLASDKRYKNVIDECFCDECTLYQSFHNLPGFCTLLFNSIQIKANWRPLLPNK